MAEDWTGVKIISGFGARNADRQDLNDLRIDDDTRNGLSLSQARQNLCPVDATVEVVFSDIVPRLVSEIRKWPAVVGCTAWLTESSILSALEHCDFVSLIVQKEDFLRPDDGQTIDSAKHVTLERYTRLPVGSRYTYCAGAEEFGMLSFASDPILAPVRCVGVRPDDKKSRNHPRMHHKFLVFCSIIAESSEGREGIGPSIQPELVWTGSFNPTHNGSRSIENGVMIKSRNVAECYAHEHGIMLALSEPLNWTDRYVAPEYRIGT